MESTQNLKSRLRAVRNINQITKAMEVVSATKMRKAQEAAINSRMYAIQALHLLGKVAPNVPHGVSPLLARDREVKTTLIVVVTSDRGLAGSFNSQVFRATDALLAKDEYTAKPDHKFAFVAVGKKAIHYASKQKGELVQSFTGFGDFAKAEEIAPLSNLVVEGFLAGRWDRVITISTHFRTTLTQDVLMRQIFPVDFKKVKETVEELIPEHGRFSELRTEFLNGDNPTDYIFEPTPTHAIHFLIPRLITMQLYHLVLEANASEHSARRVAMKAASDNADELAGGLEMQYNKSRQAAITKELIEITSTQNAL